MLHLNFWGFVEQEWKSYICNRSCTQCIFTAPTEPREFVFGRFWKWRIFQNSGTETEFQDWSHHEINPNCLDKPPFLCVCMWRYSVHRHTLRVPISMYIEGVYPYLYLYLYLISISISISNIYIYIYIYLYILYLYLHLYLIAISISISISNIYIYIYIYLYIYISYIYIYIYIL